MAFHNFIMAVVSFYVCRTDGASLTSVRDTRDMLRTKPSVPRGEPARLRATQPSPLPAKQVRLEIHYEVLCPRCSRIIGTDLRSIWDDAQLRELLDVSMFPAGNVEVFPVEHLSDGWRAFHPELVADHSGHIFQCQHGEEECLGNMIHACAMQMLGGPADYLPFLFCMESAATDESVENAAFKCASETTTLDVKDIVTCTRSAEANQMMFGIFHYSDSLSPPREHTPWVVINGEHQGEADDGDLLGSICRALEVPLPAACN